MEVSINSKKENQLLEREEITFTVNHDLKGTPSREEIKNKLAALLNVDTQKLFIKKIETEYGASKSKGTANIYKSSERALLVEPKYIVKRNLGEPETEKGKKAEPKEKPEKEKKAEPKEKPEKK
ncbi:MAG: 30S ribosomal protein S24e [Candidatus Freyarchaeum deiterrae]